MLESFEVMSSIFILTEYDRIQIILIKGNQSNVISINKGIADIKQWCLINSVSINMDDITSKDSSISSSPDYHDIGKISWGEHIKFEDITLIPHSGKKANNKLIINGILIEGIQNSGFDFLYYLLWLKINKPDGKDYFNWDEGIPEKHLRELLPGTNFEKLNRFNHSWADFDNPRKREKNTQQSIINSKIIDKSIMSFELIVTGKNNHHISNSLLDDNIELISFLEMI